MTVEVPITEYLTAPNASVSLARLDSYPNVLLMTWEQDVRIGDVSVAFKHINACLDDAKTPLYVLVDIRNQPKFPMAETIYAAVRGPYRHPQMAAWLMIGDSRLARMIQTTISNLTRRNNMEWFETMHSALDYLQTHNDHSAQNN